MSLPSEGKSTSKPGKTRKVEKAKKAAPKNALAKKTLVKRASKGARKA
jgi:hypothetical protein